VNHPDRLYVNAYPSVCRHRHEHDVSGVRYVEGRPAGEAGFSVGGFRSDAETPRRRTEQASESVADDASTEAVTQCIDGAGEARGPFPLFRRDRLNQFRNEFGWRADTHLDENQLAGREFRGE
jgi:hypothetical protein